MFQIDQVVAYLVTTPNASKKYINYLAHFALSRIEHHTALATAVQEVTNNTCKVCFITHEYLESLEDWGEMISSIHTANDKGVAVIALLEYDSEPIVLARAFDYGFDEVLCLGPSNHEFSARLRHCIVEVQYKHSIGTREGIDRLTGLMRSSMLDNHLIASQAYAARHGHKLYATRFCFNCINQDDSHLTLSEKDRLIQTLSSTLKSVCRPYDAAFSPTRTNFFVIWNSICGLQVPIVSTRIAQQLRGVLSDSMSKAKVGVEIYNIPVDSTCDIEKLQPFEAIAIE